MDITGREAGYRGAAVRCPGCAYPMTIEPLAEADVDVCNACHGVWIDWFDGELRAVATETVRKDLVGRPTDPGASRNEAIATGACPRCTRQLVAERYTVAEVVPGVAAHTNDAGSATINRAEIDLLRCEECAGAFVTRDAALALAALTTSEVHVERTSAAPAAEVLDPMPWQRFLALLKRLLGMRA